MSSNQGFERSLNLAESEDDRQILNNLGGGNIQLDIALFRNNKRNTSTLVWRYNIDNSSISNNKFIFPSTTQFIFTNGDEVKVSGASLGALIANKTYYIVGLERALGQLKNQQAFSLSLTKDGTAIPLGSITNDVTFVRRDETTQTNIFNIAQPESLEQDQTIQRGTFEYDIGGTFSNAFDTIDSNIDSANFIRNQKYVINQSIATDRQINIEGSFLNEDPANTNTTAANMLQAKSPGVYITDPFSSVLSISKTRAYSSNSQPWKEAVGKLTTASTQVNIGDLFFENGITIDNFDGIVDQSGGVGDAATGFTHKLPVKINGIDYYVLIRKV